VFENVFDIAHVQLIVDETNKYAQQEILKSIKPLTFCSRIQNVHGFGTIYVEWHCAKAYT
jgi:hypothetical protein